MIRENLAPQQVQGVVSPTLETFFERILVATDFSPASERALDYAVSIARRFSSKIYLTHVITLDGYPMIAPEVAETFFAKLRKEAEEELARIQESGQMYGVAHETMIEEGTLWAALEARIKQDKIDLVVVGTHGAGGIQKMVIGSGAEQVFRHSSVPVLTVGPYTASEPLYEAEFKNILFATDFGPSVDREAAYAFALAKEHRARITLLHVLPAAKEYSAEGVTREREVITQQLKELVPVTPNPTWKAEFVMVIGDSVEEILGYAGKTKADLIVMGAKHHKGLVGHLPRTKAYRVATSAKCPVLTVRS
jgi:nucleotide-binding universal stress UspA family protein